MIILDFIQVTISGGLSAIDNSASTPIANSRGVFITFIEVLLSLSSAISAYKVYSEWQSGNSDAIDLVSRWLYAAIISIFLIAAIEFF